MKLLVIHGSMRKGNTYKLTQEIVKHLASKPDVEIVEVSVAELGLPFCCSCHNCFLMGEEHCPSFAITGNIKSLLTESDGIIVGGTTYMWALNAALKNLLDHFAYMFHRPVLFGKKAMVVTTSAGKGEKSVAKYLKSVLGQMGINGAIVVTRNAKEISLSSPNGSLQAKEVKKLERFYLLIKQQRYLPPSVKNITIHNAFRAMSLKGLTESERDTKHWQAEGFANRAYPVKAGFLKYLIGSLTYRVIQASIFMIGRAYAKKNKAPQ